MIAPPPRSASRKKKRHPGSPRAKSPRGGARSPRGARSPKTKPQKKPPVIQPDDDEDDLLGLNHSVMSNFSNEDGVPQANGDFTDRLKLAIASDGTDDDTNLFDMPIQDSPSPKGKSKGNRGSRGSQGSSPAQRAKSPGHKARGRTKSPKIRRVATSPKPRGGRVKSPKSKTPRARSIKKKEAPKLIRPTTAPTPRSHFPDRARSPGRAKSPKNRTPKVRSPMFSPAHSSRLEDDEEEEEVEEEVQDSAEDGEEVRRVRSHSAGEEGEEGEDQKENEDDEEADLHRMEAYAKKNLPAGWFQKLSAILESSLTSDRLLRMACKLHVDYEFPNAQSFLKKIRREFGKSLWNTRLDELMLQFFKVVSDAPAGTDAPGGEKLLRNATTVDKLKALGISLTYTCSRMDPNCKFRTKEFEEYRVHCEQTHKQIIDQSDIQLTKLSIPGVGTSDFNKSKDKDKKDKKDKDKKIQPPTSPTFSFGFKKKKKFNWG